MMQGWNNWAQPIAPDEALLEFVDAHVFIDPNTFAPYVLARVKMPLTPDMELKGGDHCRDFAEQLIRAKIK